MNKQKASVPNETFIFSLINSRFTDQLARGIIPWHTTWKEPPKDLFGAPFSGINLWLLVNTQYSRNIFLSKTQITSFNVTVKKKEQGHIVFASSERRGKKSFTYDRVYNIDQLEGIQDWWIPPLTKNHNIRQRCREIVEKMANPPQIIDYGSSVFYSVKNDSIYLPLDPFFENDQQVYSALFYALVQSTGHSKRLHRETCEHRNLLDPKLYSCEELIAEMGSTILCSYVGIEPWYVTKHHADAEGWLQKMQKDITLVTIAAMRAGEAVDYILNLTGPKYLIERDYIL
jgi:antirestriction protein ArdC